MHVSQLAELAGIVAIQAPSLVRSRTLVCEESIHAYWTASKCRLDRWGRAMNAARTASGPRRNGPRGARLAGVIQEVLTSEILTRVWAAVAQLHDQARDALRLSPVAESVLGGHLEARSRALRLIAESAAISSKDSVRLNRLRRRTERWSDMLVGYLLGLGDVGRYAVDPERARDFAEDIRYGHPRRGGQQAGPLLTASLGAAFTESLSGVSPNADLNERIAGGVLACFPPEIFDGTGMAHSAWTVRMGRVADETQLLIDDLFRQDASPAGDAAPGRLPFRRSF